MDGQIVINDLPMTRWDERPNGVFIDTLIIHSMYNPDSEDHYSALSCKRRLDAYEVSAHYLIDIDGAVWRAVAEDKKAWHAGRSKMPDPEDGREDVNDFSIGIELIGSEDTEFTDAQYKSLAQLTKDIMSRHHIRNIYGHSDIAPGRKTDPWGFDWRRYRADVLRLSNKTGLMFCDAALA